MAKSKDDAENKKEKKGFSRDDELSEKEEFLEDLTKIATMVEEGFRAQNYRTEDQKDYWDIYECKLTDHQGYNGNAQAYAPLVRDSIDARQTRFTNQLFPINGRFIDCVTENGDIPHALMALLEYYIRRMNLRTKIIPALCKNGDVEGQYNLYVDWKSFERFVTTRKKEDDGAVEKDVVEESVVIDEGPDAECIPDADIVILPAISDSIQEALARGGCVAITRRWSKAKIEQMIEAKEIPEEIGEHLCIDMKTAANLGQTDMKKEHVSSTGIKAKGNWFLAREVWHTLEINGQMRICRSYFGAGERLLLGTKLNPFWSDMVPVFSAPVKKMAGAFKGGSLVSPVAQLQYLANDYLNQAADSATYSMMPIVMTDPNKNPKTSTMILDLAAVWEVDPNSTVFAKFPEIWKNGLELVMSLKAQIQQSLSVNPAMIPASSGKQKRSQADIANEQQVDILTTADAVTVIEEGILNPVLNFIVGLDMQYRHDDMLIPQFGMMGKRAKMEKVSPIQQDKRYQFTWMGAQAARDAARIQQQIAGVNVIKGIPPQMYEGYKLNLVPLLESFTESLFGPRLAPLIFVSLKDQMSMDQDEENEMLAQGFEVPISPMDDDQEHIKKLQPLIQNPGLSPEAMLQAKVHLQKHQTAMQMKAMAAMQQAMHQKGLSPGGGPREGAQPGAPRPQGPPGMIGQDSMPGAGAVPMPRRAAGGNA